MKSLKKFAFLSLAALAITGCSNGETPEEVTYERKEEEASYASVLGGFDQAFVAATAVSNDNARYIAYAKAEAKLLSSAVMLPTITQGGAYAMSRVAPHTVPYVTFGLDSDRLRGAVIVANGDDSASKKFISAADYQALRDSWQNAVDAGNPALYTPKADLTAAGYSFATSFNSTFVDSVTTLDANSTYYASDTETLCNSIEGLVEWNNIGQLKGRCAVDELPVYNATEKSYTFELRSGLKWYTNTGAVYGNLTATDFVRGFQHSLDASTGTGFYELCATVKNAAKYFTEKHDTAWFDANVGFEAVDDTHVKITLDHDEPYFLTRLTYSPFMPISDAFFTANGGAYGVKEFAAAKKLEAYTYGSVKDNGQHLVYNSAFYPTKIQNGVGGEIIYTRNVNYWDNANTQVNELKWVYDKGDKPMITFQSVLDGDLTATGLSEAAGTLKKAKDDGYFAKYAYITDTNATTFLAGFNVNRGTFSVGETVASSQSEEQKIATNKAMNNLNFRRALQHAWDREVYNAKSKGSEVAKLSIRNLYTQPNFVRLSADTYDEASKHTFRAGEYYYQLVEYFLRQEVGYFIDLSDSQDGWYNPILARGYLEAAKADLGDEWAKVELDIVYLSSNPVNTAQAQAFKESVEAALGAENVQVNIIGTDDTTDFYAAGYRAGTGVDGCFDVFYGSGWGPDFQDPSSYLATFAASGSGEMIKITGNY